MTYVIDIDGTICTQCDSDYEKAHPIDDRIRYFNGLYEDGNKIVYHTARGMGRFNNDQKKANDLLYELTKKQLDSWGVKYHQLFLGKPAGDYYIDDKGVNDEDFFNARN